MKKLFNKFPESRRIKRAVIWIKRKMNPQDFVKIGKSEREAFIIFKTLVNDPDSELLTHPSNEKMYIKSTKAGLFMTISAFPHEASIINHVYGYNVQLSFRMRNNMAKIFMAEIDKRRKSMEEEFKGNIQHSLHNISKTIKERL